MKTTNKKDWHKAMITAGVHMADTTLRQLSIDNNLYPTALSVALHRPWPKAEGIIAAAIGVKPWEIWPTRYAHRAEKLARRKVALNAPAASIGQCSHDCNINMSDEA